MPGNFIFPVASNISNVLDPVTSDQVATRNYVDQNAGGLFLDTPGTTTNAIVASGAIVLQGDQPGGGIVNAIVQTTGAAGTETQIVQFINGRGASQVWAFAGFPNQTFTIASTTPAPGIVVVGFPSSVNFPSTVPAGTALQYVTAPVYTPFRDLVLGTNLAGTIANNPLNRPTLTLNASGGGTSGSAINLAGTYVGDNVGVLVRVASNDPTVSNISGSLAAVTDYGSINITSTPWPPAMPAGYNTYFVIIEAADYSWSGCGTIQTNPSNAIIQIAWIRKPTVASGTTFTGGRLWITVNANSALWTTTSVANIANVNPTTALVLPDLTAGSITTASDGFGSNASLVRVVPTIDSRIAAQIGSVGTINQYGDTTAPLIASVSANSIVLDSQEFGPTLVNKYIWINSTASNLAGTTVLVTSGANTGPLQYTIQCTGNPITAGFTNTATGIWFSDTATPNAFVFQTPPRNSIIQLAQQNTVPSLNGLQGTPLNLVAGTGIGISTTSPNITITNTGSGSGISASNFTSFVNDLGQSLGTQGYIAFVSSTDQTGYVGLGMDSDVAANDGGFIAGTKYIGTTSGTAVSTYGYSVLYPVATSYTDLEIQVYVPAMVITFTSTFSSGWDIELYFSRADSTAANDPGKMANLFPGFQSGPSDLVALNILRASPVVFAPVAGQANTYTATISAGGLYAAVTNNYNHTATTVGFLPWIRIDGPAITGITSVVINQSSANAGNSGGFRSLVALPGVGGATPTLDQVLQTGNSSARNLTLTGTAVLAAPNLALNNAGANTITLRTPAAVASSYALTFPNSQPTYGQALVTTDAAGNFGWFLAGLEMIRLASTVNVTPNGAQTVDGVAVATNDRVLLTNQTTTATQGLYVANTGGAWSRITTYPSQSLFVQQGTANANRTYTRNETASPEQWILTGGGAGTVPTLQQVTTAGALTSNSIQIGTSTDNLTLASAQISRSAPGNVRILGGTGVGDGLILGSSASTAANFLQVNSGSGTTVGPTLSVSGASGAPLNLAGGVTGPVNIGISTTNYVQITPSASGAPIIAAAGSANVNLDIRAAGVNSVNIGSNLANYVTVTPNSAGATAGPGIAAVGSDTNINLRVTAKGSGVLQLNNAGGGGISLGPIVTATYSNPLYAASGLNPGTDDLTFGTQGQVLTSRGNGTPAWVTPPAGPNVYAYALLNDQSVGGSSFAFNATATIAAGTSFGSFTSASTFTFTRTGSYQVSFSYNNTGGGTDLSIVIAGTRVAGATTGGKQGIIGVGSITAVNQTLQITNYATGTFSASQSSIVITRIG